MVIHPCAKYGKPMSNEKKSYVPNTKTCQKPYKFDLEVKYTQLPNMVGQCQTKKSYWPDTKPCQKPYKFDFEFKVQGRI